jgi:RluA family pseudouridine synthase
MDRSKRVARSLRIVHEDRDMLIVDKPSGLLTSTTPREKRPTLLKMVQEHIARGDPRARVGLIHRLDRDASGLLIFSKNNGAYRSLKTQFFRHSVERTYLAIVRGVPTPRDGTIDTRLLELPDGRVVRTRQHAKGQRAVTEYETIRTCGRMSLLRVLLRTGRKHQIRSQLADRGTPVVNDPIYGDEKPAGPLGLCAVELAIDHPRTGKRMTFRIDPPKAMIKLLGPDQ